MSQKKPIFPGIKSLTKEDLADWAGMKVLSRGESYQRQGAVRNISITETGVLLADVNGSKRYSLALCREETGDLYSICTCPYEIDCKHAVAALLEYIEKLDKCKKVEIAEADDERLQLLDLDEEWNDDEEDEDEYDEPVAKVKASASGSTAKTGTPAKDIKSFLSNQNKNQLLSILMSLVEELPQVRTRLQEKLMVQQDDAEKLLKSLRSEIRRVSSIEAWSDHWSGEGEIPDYSGVRRKMRLLLEAGHADALLEIGEELLSLGQEQVGNSNDEGETQEEVSDCIPLLVEALRGSSLSEIEKLLWAFEAVLADKYDICDALNDFIYDEHSTEAWDGVTDALLEKLHRLPAVPKDYSEKFLRERIVDWLVNTLESAGRTDEVLALCEEEAERTFDYHRPIKIHIEAGRYEEAMLWIQKGKDRTKKDAPGIASNLRDFERKIHGLRNDVESLVLLEVEDFVSSPGVFPFVKCRKACAVEEDWQKMRQILLDFLVQGILPWDHSSWPLSKRSSEKSAYSQKNFPMIHFLLDIALEEKLPGEVRHWYLKQTDKLHTTTHDKVATVIGKDFPEHAVRIWKMIAEKAIARVSPDAYAEAGGYLKKMRNVMKDCGQEREYRLYIAGLRKQHARKKRFLEVLDTLEGKPLYRGTNR